MMFIIKLMVKFILNFGDLRGEGALKQAPHAIVKWLGPHEYDNDPGCEGQSGVGLGFWVW